MSSGDKMLFYKIKINEIPRMILMNWEHLIPPRQHLIRRTTEYILYFIAAGRLALNNNGEELSLQPGDIYIFQKGDYQFPLKTEDCEYWYLHFDADISQIELTEKELNEEIWLRRNYFLSSSKYESNNNSMEIILPKYMHIGMNSLGRKISMIFKEGAITAGSPKNEYYKTLSALKASELFIELYRIFANRQLSATSTFGAQMIQELAAFLEKHSDRNITSNMLQEKLGYNFDYMNRKFKAAIGKTNFQY